MIEDDAQIAEILRRTQVIACVGFSANPDRPSHYVSQFLVSQGKRVVPVNPGLAGQDFLGQPIYATLSDIPPDIPVDMVDVFRRLEHVPDVVDEALFALPHLRTVWLQLGLRDEATAQMATARGIDVVQDRCPKLEIPRLGLLA